MNSKKSKVSSVNRLPSLYAQTLIKSEYDYQREIRQKLDQIQHDNRDVVRRRLVNSHLFAHKHLAKRYHWFHVDKSYRDSCEAIWDRDAAKKTRTNHVQLPAVQTNDDGSTVNNASITQNFLRVQPVMLEVLNAPHSSQILRHKQHVELRKKSAQQRFQNIQTNAKDDQRYTRLVFSLEEAS